MKQKTKKLREIANAMPKKKKRYEFVDKAGLEGTCNVTLPAERFSYIITRETAENLLVKHGYNLPFDIMTPCLEESNAWEKNEETGELEGPMWMGLMPDDLEDGKLDKDRKEFEIWLNIETTD